MPSAPQVQPAQVASLSSGPQRLAVVNRAPVPALVTIAAADPAGRRCLPLWLDAWPQRALLPPGGVLNVALRAAALPEGTPKALSSQLQAMLLVVAAPEGAPSRTALAAKVPVTY